MSSHYKYKLYNAWSLAHTPSGFSVKAARGHCHASLNVDSPSFSVMVPSTPQLSPWAPASLLPEWALSFFLSRVFAHACPTLLPSLNQSQTSDPARPINIISFMKAFSDTSSPPPQTSCAFLTPFGPVEHAQGGTMHHPWVSSSVIMTFLCKGIISLLCHRKQLNLRALQLNEG